MNNTEIKSEMSDRPTPETDAEVGYFDFDPVSADFARRLERERDKAREDATNYYARIGELESERDELKEIVEQRILVGAEIHNKANSLIKQNDKTEAECERLRKQLTAAASALRQIHLEVGDWIRSTVIVKE